MKNNLNAAIEVLYQTFSEYPRNPNIVGCPCCVSDMDKSLLHTSKLRDLVDEDISKYAFKAITTWGDVDDFKHYLPRIFELTAKQELAVNTFVVLGKLKIADWRNWDKSEQKAINEFLIAWWIYDINCNSHHFDFENMIEINKLIHNLTFLLEKWILEINSLGFKNFVFLIENHLEDILQNSGDFKDFNINENSILINWIKTHQDKLGVDVSNLKDDFFKDSVLVAKDKIANI
ncbi:hypothetical protein [Chondrinema litorale]|uniref:hypothetical protein n=1 Tax=Chondrinema litorale TaxID=2994555 RepID=UPI0025439415|nr:hypothetical protein [Chondrinema litorale]UZR99627.1 hypothetical protein OQ292_37190 [Chondrinema litorale]